MTTLNKNLIEPKYVANVQTTQYIVSEPLLGTIRAVIDVLTVSNISANDVDFSCNLVGKGSTPGNTNLILPPRTLGPGETYLCPEIVGQVLEGGGYISTLASLGSSLVIRSSGREITLS